VEGVVIAAQVKLAKTLGLPPQWVAALRSYGEVYALATAVPPNSYEEILAMPVFGSPHILERGRQI
jgi:hypothetical protein